MSANYNSNKGTVHLSGTLLRRVWWSKERTSCIVVRPAGPERDSVGYVVNQVRFEGPTEMVYDTTPRNTGRDPKDKCAPHPSMLQGEAAMHGHVGTLNGFDNAILVYLQADEHAIHVQALQGDAYVSFPEFRKLVASGAIKVPILNPMLEMND